MGDLLFSRYGAYADNVMRMDFELGFEYIQTAIEKWQEELLYQRWLNGYQEIAYEEFKLKVSQVKESDDSRSEEEILEKVKSIINERVVL